MKAPTPQPVRVRLDKWLWAARFYKTRAVAGAAINGGKVQVNSARAKASKALQPGDIVRVRKGQLSLEVVVRELSERRGPPAAAAQLFEETATSRERREAQREERRLARAAAPTPPSVRPNKRDRRRIIRFTGKGETS
jgi:ribosome-associated heat shock protein Hsp15